MGLSLSSLILLKFKYMVFLATYYPTFDISTAYEIPQSLREILYTTWQFQYEELYEKNDEEKTISLEETLNQVLEALNSKDGLGHQRYIFMAIILAKAVEPTILAYKPNDTRPQKVFQLINQRLDKKNVSETYINSLFSKISTGYQAFDEALDAFRNILNIFEPRKAQKALLEILDNCLEGYAIFPGLEGRRDLFNWWLLEVVPASWSLKEPKFLYTIYGVQEFKESISSIESSIFIKFFNDRYNGEGEIRTLGRLPFTRFQVERIRPLCHLSKELYSTKNRTRLLQEYFLL